MNVVCEVCHMPCASKGTVGVCIRHHVSMRVQVTVMVACPACLAEIDRIAALGYLHKTPQVERGVEHV